LLLLLESKGYFGFKEDLVYFYHVHSKIIPAWEHDFLRLILRLRSSFLFGRKILFFFGGSLCFLLTKIFLAFIKKREFFLTFGLLNIKIEEKSSNNNQKNRSSKIILIDLQSKTT